MVVGIGWVGNERAGRTNLPSATIFVDANRVIFVVEVRVLLGPLQERQEIIKLYPVIEGLGELAMLSRYHVLGSRISVVFIP